MELQNVLFAFGLTLSAGLATGTGGIIAGRVGQFAAFCKMN